MTTTPTHCPYCALQCAMRLGAPAADGPPSVAGRDFPTNGGSLCRKGWTSAEVLAAPDRLTTPLVRDARGRLRPAAWSEALDRVASAARSLRARYGPDSVAVFGAGGLTNEKAYQLGKFARLALGTSRIDYNGRFCMASAAAAAQRAFGLDRGLPFPLADLGAAGAVLLLGSNVADTMPPFVRHLEGARSRGGLVVVDPRRSATARLADDGGGLHLQPAPGTDLVLLLGLAHVVVAEGLEDAAFLAARTSGADAVRRSVAAWWPERVQAETGVPAPLVREAARRLASAARAGRAGGPGAYVLTGRGVEQHANGTDTTTAAVNLALLLGLPGSAAGGYGTVTGQGNGQGGREHGQKADQLPGYGKITDPAARAHVASVWGVDPADLPGPGVPATELLHTLGLPGGSRMLLVHGSNPVVSSPDAGRTVEALRRLDLLVVCDFFLSETAELADVVLPVAQWAEEEGTMTNLEGRVLRRRRAVEAPAGVAQELWVLAELARRLGAPGRWPTDPAEVFAELCAASAGGPADYSGLDYAGLDAGREAYWPCPEPAGPGTPRLFLDRFAHPDGLARLVPVAPGGAAEELHAPGTVALLTGRLLEHYQSGAQTRRVASLLAAAPEPRAELHPATAHAAGIADGDAVVVTTARGRATARALLTEDLRPDSVFLPFHFPGGGRANSLTGAATDPVSGMPAFKNAAATIERAGAGMPGPAGGATIGRAGADRPAAPGGRP